MDPTLAEYAKELAKPNLSPQNREYLDRLYQQELVQPSQPAPQQAPAQQGAPPAQANAALDKLIAQAKGGDAQAQAILKANGIPWQ